MAEPSVLLSSLRETFSVERQSLRTDSRLLLLVKKKNKVSVLKEYVSVDGQTWCQNGVAMFKANDLSHLLQYLVLHEDENGSYLVREPTKEEKMCPSVCVAAKNGFAFTCSCWQQLLAILRPERRCPVHMTVG